MAGGADILNEFEYLLSRVDDFWLACQHFEKPLSKLAKLVRWAFQAEFDIIKTGITTPEPDEEDLKIMLQPLTDVIQKIQAFRVRNHHIREIFFCLSTVSEAIVALRWISVKVSPVQFIKDILDAGKFYENRALSYNKGHFYWISKWNFVMKSLENYVHTFHLTGFAWNFAGSVSCLTMHLPPPLPPLTSHGMALSEDHIALLHELYQDLGIDEMLQSTRPSEVPAVRAIHSRTDPPVQINSPKNFLDGRKWRVEHQLNVVPLKITVNNISESLVMYQCVYSGIIVMNAMNSATIDSCKHSTIILKDIISAVEARHCDHVKIQCDGHVPLISLDSCASTKILVNNTSKDAEIVSFKSSSCKLCVSALDGDYFELVIPDKIKTVLRGQKLESSIVEEN